MPQKYEQEIDEILRRMEGRLPRQPLSRRVSRRFDEISDAIGPRLASLATPTGLLIAGLVAVLLSAILPAFASGVGRPLAILAVVLFVSALVLSVVRSRRRPRRTWRGRPMEYGNGQPLIWEGAVRRWRAWRASRSRRSHF